MLHFLFVGLCYLAFRLLPSAGLCRRFSLRLPDSAAASALPSPPYLAYLVIGSICSVPPPHAVTGTPPSEGMALLTLKTLYKVSVTLRVTGLQYQLQHIICKAPNFFPGPVF